MNKSTTKGLTFGLGTFGLLLGGTANAAIIESLPLNGNTTATIGVDGTAVNGPVSTAGFDGTADTAMAFQPISYFGNFVSVPNGGGLSGATQGTISMWVKWDGLQQQTAVESLYGSVVGRQQNGSASDDVIGLNGADPSTASVSFWFNNQTGVGLTGTTPVGDGVWHYLAVTFDSTSENLYLDGKLDASVAGTFGSNSINDVPLTIGAWTGDAAGYSNSAIADFQIDDTALTGPQLSLAIPTTAVPEPATFGVILSAATTLLSRRRR